MFQTLGMMCLQPGQDLCIELEINIMMMMTIKIIKAAVYQACYLCEAFRGFGPCQPCEVGTIMVTFI